MGCLSLGREGPSVQIAASCTMRAVGCPIVSGKSEHGMTRPEARPESRVAFNTPLKRMFAIEELTWFSRAAQQWFVAGSDCSRRFDGGLGHLNLTYFAAIRVQNLSVADTSPGLIVAVCSVSRRGPFSRRLCPERKSTDWFSWWRQKPCALCRRLWIQPLPC
jgi:hypothetical protein